ncbi:basic helix-loop-helix transcription factor scleraxis-like isoform X1 [Harmonia axyridis]|uniref:basic helix-loop-helix transcription factor scleraxis-like isoform X1 n=1 Tax=Harmonia axyridis TaxID=115357 RepID=UPI001E2775E9|nr:basic helix-loop-helix transcription factor scleraxis-like isoform X1 [Harmonia axyridis]
MAKIGMEYVPCEGRLFIGVDQCEPIQGQEGGYRRKGKTRCLIRNKTPPPPRQRNQANARERDRTLRFTTENVTVFSKNSKRNDGVNTAFSILRTLIPTEPKDRKLSKIETLRLASSYISHLGTQLITGSADQPCLQMFKSSGEEHNFNRSQVCTFCMAGKKIPKLCYSEDSYSTSCGEHQFYFDQSSNAILLAENTSSYNQTYLI